MAHMTKIVSLRMFFLSSFIGWLTVADYPVLAQHEGHEAPVATKQETVTRKAARQKDVYYCPMHPTYVSDRPGDCPICNMKLVKKEPAVEQAQPANRPTGLTAKDI